MHIRLYILFLKGTHGNEFQGSNKICLDEKCLSVVNYSIELKFNNTQS